MKKCYFLIFFLTCYTIIPQSYAQTSDTLNETAKIEVSTADGQDSTPVNAVEIQQAETDAPGIPMEFWHSMIILIFGVLIISIEVYLIIRGQIEAKDIMKYIVVTLIITCVMFLITAGHNNNQIAPAMGLLGTIAGYLLGKGSNNNEKSENAG